MLILFLAELSEISLTGQISVHALAHAQEQQSYVSEIIAAQTFVMTTWNSVTYLRKTGVSGMNGALVHPLAQALEAETDLIYVTMKKTRKRKPALTKVIGNCGLHGAHVLSHVLVELKHVPDAINAQTKYRLKIKTVEA